MGNLAAYIFLCLVQSLYDYVPEKEYWANKNIFNSKFSLHNIIYLRNSFQH